MAGVEDKGRSFEGATPGSSARAKLFTHGGSQAVRLPKAFRFEGSEVAIRREGDKVILEPAPTTTRSTDEERKAFWAEIDALRGGELLAYPPRDPGYSRDAPFED
jgi:antitoxin VapB